MAAAGADPGLDRLQQALGHAFADPGLLRLALTHSSTQGANHQRLEFLGDAILGAAVSAALYRQHPDWDEGQMSVTRTHLVRQEHLAECARRLAVPGVLRVSAAVARSGAVHERSSVLADTLEALLGAVFLDGGYAAASAVAERLLLQDVEAAASPVKDAKTSLQEWLHARGWPAPVYALLATSGPDNAREFRAGCRAGRPLQTAEGSGRSRKSAEQAAAARLLAALTRGAEPSVTAARAETAPCTPGSGAGPGEGTPA